jgi:hypothetical protein
MMAWQHKDSGKHPTTGSFSVMERGWRPGDGGIIVQWVVDWRWPDGAQHN